METIKAKSKYEALKNAGYEKIYFSGNNPYSVRCFIYTYKITASKYNNNEYIIISDRIK
jgi:hypothetical protein